MKKQLLFLATLCVFVVGVIFASPPGHHMNTADQQIVFRSDVCMSQDRAAIGKEVCPAFCQQTSVMNFQNVTSMKTAALLAHDGTVQHNIGLNHEISTTKTYSGAQRILHLDLYKRDAYQRHIEFADNSNSLTSIRKSMVYIC